MESYNDIKNQLLRINSDLRNVIDTALTTEGVSGHQMDEWRNTTERIDKQLAEETVRLAIVGSIKSGKSTLTNSLFNGDYVKRGAGVITSIVTKVRPGPHMTARLEFKTWKEVNSEIKEALVLFSALETLEDYREFDINDDNDRQRLQSDLSKLEADQLIAHDARDPNSVLLIEYIKGYEEAKSYVSFEPETAVLEEDGFFRQKEFVGNESLAVYLKDVTLTLRTPKGFGENIEVADCQGSDSPNPLHLAMIQDYLLQTHLIVYVLSSRTGVRQSDIKFLTLIKKMGLAKNLLFVLNSDFNEHEDLPDLRRVAARVEEELGLIVSAPDVYTFSALYNLFKSIDSESDNGMSLSRKEKRRLEQWKEEEEFVFFSDAETAKFFSEVIHKITTNRYTLLLEANVERLANISSGMQEWARIGRKILETKTEEMSKTFAEMERRRKASDQVTVVVKDTLDGTTSKLKGELSAEVDRFFDVRFGDIGQQIVQFVDGYNLEAADFENDLEATGFLPTLYRIFQVLQQAVNRFIAETINPRLVAFLNTLENKLAEVFEQVSGPYSLMIEDAVRKHQDLLIKLGLTPTGRIFKPIRPPEIAVIKNNSQVRIPQLASTLRYTARIKTEAILRLGFYNTVKTARKLFKKPDTGPESAIRSLQDSIRRIKEQIQISIMDHFVDYKENLKHQYVFLLTTSMADGLYETLTDQMAAFTGDLSDMKHLIENDQETKGKLTEKFSVMEKALSELQRDITGLERMVSEG